MDAITIEPPRSGTPPQKIAASSGGSILVHNTAVDQVPTPSTVSSTKSSSKMSSAVSVGTATGGGRNNDLKSRHQRAASDDLARIIMLSDESQKSGGGGGSNGYSFANNHNNNNAPQRGQYPPSQIVYTNTATMSPNRGNENSHISSSSSNGHHHHQQQQRQQQYLPFPGPVPGLPYQPSQFQPHHHLLSKDRPSWSADGNNPYNNNMMVPPSLSAYPPYQTSAVPSSPGMGAPMPAASLTYSPGSGGPYFPVVQDPAIAASLPNFPPFKPSLPPPPRDGGTARTATSARNLVGGGNIGSIKRKDYPGHRRVHSYNGIPSYGTTSAADSGGQTTISGVVGAPPLPATRRTAGAGQQNSSGKTAEFSPRAEFRKLAGTGGNTISSPRMSPIGTSASPRRSPPPLQLSPRTSRRGLSPLNRAMSEDYRFKNSNINGITTTTNLRPLVSSLGASDFAMMQQQLGYHHHHSAPQMTLHESSDDSDSDDETTPSNDDGMPVTPSRRRQNNMESINGSLRGAEFAFSNRQLKAAALQNNGSERGGEATFLLTKNNHKKDNRKLGTGGGRRSMMMRQKSAQHFMESIKGTEQMPSCRDVIFLLLFVFHLLGIVYLGNTYGFGLFQQSPNDVVEEDGTTAISSSFDVNYLNLIYLAGMSGIFAVTISAVMLCLMMVLANNIVQIALAITITFSFVWGTMGIGLSPKKVVPATGFIALALSVGYAFIVWDRIPFVASNLDAGLKGIRANPGVILIAFFFQFLALGWSIYYTFVVVGLYDAIQNDHIGDSHPWIKYAVYTLLGLSYYWTLQVFLNIVQVTVAGVIGSWWYKPDDDVETRGADLNHAFFRSCFYSLGSICFGSLFVGPVKILRQLSVFFRPSEEVTSLLCLHECLHCIQTCLTSIVESLADRFSSWSFTYVGLYGYGFIDAGLLSAELFDKRGWTTIVSDDLVPNVLLLSSLVIGGTTGLFAFFIENMEFEFLSLASLEVPSKTSFAIGCLVGLVVSSVLFGIISSSVNAVIVLFAASPVDFEGNHPKLSEEMRTSWGEVWPGCLDVVDMRVPVGGYIDPMVNASMRASERHPLLA